MKRISFATILVICFVVLAAQGANAQGAAAPKAATQKAEANAKEGKKFSASRDPFLSKEEVQSIDRARLAELRRIEEERKRLEAAEKARKEAEEKQRLLEEELKKNPAREVINRIRVEGILGREAIINGQIKGIGDSVLGARVTRVSDTSVTFVYKGQSFVKRLPLNTGVGVL